MEGSEYLMEKMDFLSLLESFGTPITVIVKKDEGGKFVSGEWVKNTGDEVLELSEPFIPSSLATQLPIELNYRESGRFEDYEMIWYSSHVVPMKSIVKHHGKTYSVENAVDYTDYSNVIQYGCKAVENFVSI